MSLHDRDRDRTNPLATRSRIDVYREEELAYWSRKLGVTRSRLVFAVVKVGSTIADVRRVLGKDSASSA